MTETAGNQSRVCCIFGDGIAAGPRLLMHTEKGLGSEDTALDTDFKLHTEKGLGSEDTALSRQTRLRERAWIRRHCTNTATWLRGLLMRTSISNILEDTALDTKCQSIEENTQSQGSTDCLAVGTYPRP